MAEGDGTNGSGNVTYTVKEILARMDMKIDALQKDVDSLRRTHDERAGAFTFGRYAWAVVIALLMFAAQIPADMYYLGGGK